MMTTPDINELTTVETEPMHLQEQQDTDLDLAQSKLFTALPQSTLPSDASSPEFAGAIQNLRQQFEARTEFNFMVADQLALRGVAPNGKNVLSVGRWGNNAAVQADVRLWYTALATRLSAEHAKIPEAAKRTANNLIEQLWDTAQASAAEPMHKAMEDLQACQCALEATKAEMADIISAHNDKVQEMADQLTAEYDKGTRLSVELLEAQGQNAASANQVSILTASIAQAAMERAQERNEWALEKSAMTGALELANSQVVALKDQKNDLILSNEKASQRLVVLEESLANERNRSDSAARNQAIAIDNFREDIKEANKRADAAHQAIDDAKGQLAQAKDLLARETIETAKLRQELAAAKAEYSVPAPGN